MILVLVLRNCATPPYSTRHTQHMFGEVLLSHMHNSFTGILKNYCFTCTLYIVIVFLLTKMFNKLYNLIKYVICQLISQVGKFCSKNKYTLNGTVFFLF